MKHSFAVTLFFISLLGLSAGTSAENQTFEWKTKTETYRASFLGFSEGEVYLRLEDFPIGKKFPIEDLDEEGRNRVRELAKERRPFIFDNDVLKGKWSLSEMVAPPTRGREYKTVPPGHFDVMGLRAGMSDTEVVEVLAKLGAEMRPVITAKSFETRWLESSRGSEVPRAEQKHVTNQIVAALRLDASGNPVTDWAKIKNSEFSQTRMFNLKFLENTGTEPTAVIVYELTMSVTLNSGGDREKIENLLVQTATSRFGPPKELKYWEFQHLKTLSAIESLAVRYSGIQLLSPWVELIVSENNNRHEELLKKGNTHVEKSLGF